MDSIGFRQIIGNREEAPVWGVAQFGEMSYPV